MDVCNKRQFCIGSSVVNCQEVGVQTVFAHSSYPIGSHYSVSSKFITLATEDANFYQNPGFDLRAILRSDSNN